MAPVCSEIWGSTAHYRLEAGPMGIMEFWPPKKPGAALRGIAYNGIAAVLPAGEGILAQAETSNAAHYEECCFGHIHSPKSTSTCPRHVFSFFVAGRDGKWIPEVKNTARKIWRCEFLEILR